MQELFTSADAGVDASPGLEHDDMVKLPDGPTPVRELVQSLQRDPHECISDFTRVYIRDLYDHVVQVIEIIETYCERASDLTDSYMSRVSHRMNEIMKVPPSSARSSSR